MSEKFAPDLFSTIETPTTTELEKEEDATFDENSDDEPEDWDEDNEAE